jgi:hypothetical protein
MFRNPCILLIAISVPFDQEMELVMDEATVWNLLHYIVFLSAYNLWGWWRSTSSSRDGTGRSLIMLKTGRQAMELGSLSQ